MSDSAKKRKFVTSENYLWKSGLDQCSRFETLDRKGALFGNLPQVRCSIQLRQSTEIGFLIADSAILRAFADFVDFSWSAYVIQVL